MSERIQLKARWRARPESANECAVRMLSFLKELGQFDQLFATGWLKCADTISEAKGGKLKSVELSLSFITKLVADGVFRDERDNSVVPELGFLPGRLWNGHEDFPVHLWIHCGVSDENPRFVGLNTVRLDLPIAGPSMDRVLCADKLTELISIVVRNWNPDMASISTSSVDANLSQDFSNSMFKAGWFTYLSDAFCKIPPLPDEYETGRMGREGTLIRIKSIKRLTASSADQIRLLQLLSRLNLQANQ